MPARDDHDVGSWARTSAIATAYEDMIANDAQFADFWKRIGVLADRLHMLRRCGNDKAKSSASVAPGCANRRNWSRLRVAVVGHSGRS